MQVGDALVVFDGHGNEFAATISDLEKNRVCIQVSQEQSNHRESNLCIHLGIAISRGERMDWIIQKATELGVSTITPLRSEFSAVKLNQERAEKKLRHWRQIAISACEQSGRAVVPNIQALTPLAAWLQSTQADIKLTLHPHAPASDARDAFTPTSIALLVGAEGGLSEQELLGAKESGYGALSLGPRVLRTETAPLAAIAILQATWGDMRFMPEQSL